MRPRRPAAIALLGFALSLALSPTLLAQPPSRAQVAQLIQQGRLDAAEQQLWSVLVQQPELGWALDLLGSVRLRQKRAAEAEALFRKATSVNPNDAQAHRGLGESARAQGKTDVAIAAYDRALQLAAGDVPTRVALASLLEQAKQYQESLDAANGIPAAARPAELLPVLASDYFALGRASKVPPLVRQLMQQRAGATRVAIPFAEVLLRNGYFDDAARVLELSAPAKPSADYFRALARARQAQRRPAEAAKLLAAALKLEPESYDVLFDSARVAAEGERWEDAALFLRRAAALEPQRPEVLTKLTLALLKIHRPGEAAEVAGQLLVLRPDDEDAQYLSAIALLDTERWEAAEPAARNLVAKRPRDANAHLLFAIIEFNRGDIAAAKQALRDSLALDGNLAEAHYYVARLAEREGNFEEARKELQTALETNPSHAAAQAELGVLYLQTGDLQNARVALEQAAQLAPKVSQTRYQLGVLYTRLGLPALARSAMEQYRTLKDAEDNDRRQRGSVPQAAPAPPRP